MLSAARDVTRIVSASLVLAVLGEIDCQNMQARTEGGGGGVRVFWCLFKYITLSMTPATATASFGSPSTLRAEEDVIIETSPALGNMV